MVHAGLLSPLQRFSSAAYASECRQFTLQRQKNPLRGSMPHMGNMCSSSPGATPRRRLRSAKQAIHALMRTASRKTAEPAAPARPGPFKRISVQPGTAEPLGPSKISETAKAGVNFALYSEHATSITLVLSDRDDKNIVEIPLEPEQHRTGNVWHAAIEGCPLSGVLYGYRVDGQTGWDAGDRWESSRLLLDPYAPLIKGRAKFAERDQFERYQDKLGSVFRGTFELDAAPFDWGKDYKRPNLAPEEVIVYEMGVRSFTADESSKLGPGQQGTYAGLMAKIPHLKELGITAVELLPVFEYDELEFQRSPNPRDHMVNIWGYSHLSFFAPMSRFGSGGKGPAAAARELKQLVKALHSAGIEVILDVVYNHTVEGGDDDPYTMSWRGIDNRTYYMVDTTQYVQLLNYSGCGNTISGNHPVTMQLIVDSCKRWVEEYHVDGFRFDLASALCRDPQGQPMAAPPLIRELAKDPVLSKVKLIAEPWDCGGLYQVGSFPNWDVWGEWNGRYRDDVRRFVKGDQGMKAAFATRLAGSADLYNVNQRRPTDSVNFVIAHDGFTLYDLVSYNEKHNDANGEGNRDGSNDNFSWNCGVEGETDDEHVKALRQRQMRNMHMALMLSQGTPMVLMGDEYAQTRGGNNNWYGHDTKLTRFDWSALEGVRDSFFRFYSGLIKYRREHPLLGQKHFLSPQDITWHEDNWDNPESKYLAFSLHDRGQGCGDLWAAFNAHDYAIPAHLPAGKRWVRVADTSLESPRDFSTDSGRVLEGVYNVNPYTSVLFKEQL